MGARKVEALAVGARKVKAPAVGARKVKAPAVEARAPAVEEALMHHSPCFWSGVKRQQGRPVEGKETMSQQHASVIRQRRKQ